MKVYTIEIKNRYQILQDQSYDATADTMYQNIIKAHNKSTKLHVPPQNRQKRNAWITTKVSRKCKVLHITLEKQRKNSNPSNIQLEEIAKNELDESHLIKKGRYVQEKIAAIKNAHISHKTRLAWKHLMKYLEERLASKKGKIGVKHLDYIKL